MDPVDPAANPYAQFAQNQTPPDQPDSDENPYAKFAQQQDQPASDENPYAKFAQQQDPGNQRTWGQEIGRDVRGFARGILPAAGAGVGIVAGGLAAGIPGAIAGGIGGGFVADAVQNKLTDALGVDSEASRQADAANPNIGSIASELAPMAASFNVPGLGVKLAARLTNAAAMGGLDIAQQALTKGPSDIDPTEALASAGAGAVLGAPRAGIQKAGEALGSRVGAALGHSPAVTPGPAGDATAHAPPSNAKTPPVGEQTGDGFTAVPDTNEYNKSATPPAEQGVPGAETTPLTVGKGSPMDDPAIQQALKPPQQGMDVNPEAELYGGQPKPQGEDFEGQTYGNPEPVTGLPKPGVEPMPNTPPEGQNGIQPTPNRPPAAQAAIERRNPYNQLLNDQQVERRVGVQPKAARGNLDEPLTPEELASPAGEPNRPARPAVPPPDLKAQPTFPTSMISLPKATQAAIEGRPPEIYPDKTGVGSFTPPRPEGSEVPPTRTAQRNQLIDDIFPGKAEAPDTAGLETPPVETPPTGKQPSAYLMHKAKLGAARQAAASATPVDTAGLETPPKDLSLPDDGSIPDFLKRPAPQSLSGAATENPTFAAAEVAKQKSKIGEAIGNFAPVKWFRTAFTPEGLTENTGKFENIVREGQGTINQARLTSDRNMNELTSAINSTTPEARDEFARTFQTGVPKDNPLARLSSSALDTQNDYAVRIGKVDPDSNWQNGMLPAMFADKQGAKDFATQWQEDERHGVPTIGDFLNAGIKPSPNWLRQDGSIDPVRMMQNLHTAQDKFLEGKFIANKATDEGIIFPHNVPGTVPLEGLTRGGAPLYAEPEVATMWNRYFGPNAVDPTEKSFYNTAQKVKNFTTAWQLVGGGYHMVAETTEAITGDVMKAISQAAAGRFGEAGMKLKGALVAPYRQVTKSASDALEAYYDPKNAGPARAAIDYLVKGGLTPERVARYTPDINSAAHGFFTGWNVEMPQGLKGLGVDKLGMSELAAQAQKGPAGAAKSMYQLLGKSMQSVMEPMFNTYIPRLKLGASLEQMQDYIAANPNKSPDEYQTMAKRILKSTDDRLGEMNQSTLFWNNNLKKAANLLMISPGWETGTLRAAIGGGKSAITNPGRLSIQHPDFQPNAAFPFAFAITTATVGSMYQFLKTGEMPKDAKDPFFPRTGGTAANSSQPERAIMPGYLKDVYSMWHGLTGSEGMSKNASSMLYNKLAMVPRATWDTMADKDWAGKQIYDPSDPLHEKMRQYLGYVQENMMPIVAQQVTKGQKGTNISKPEAAVGIRHAPGPMQDPQKSETGIAKANKRAQDESKKFHQKTGF